MLKKLRRKFILINMLLATGVLLLVLIFNLVSTYEVERTEIDRALDQVNEIGRMRGRNGGNEPANGENEQPPEFVAEEGEQPPQSPDGEQPPEQPDGRRDGMPEMGRDDLPKIYAFSVVVDADGNITDTFALNTGMEEETLKKAVATVLARSADKGTIRSLDLIYKRNALRDGEGTQISFSSLSSLKTKMTQTALISLSVFLVGCGLLFAVSVVLSGVAIRPVQDAWEKQKRFVADVSHDLRTPLTVILANSNILRSHKDETVGSQMQWIDATDEEATRMKTLTEKMLELSRAETLSESVKLVDTDLSDLCEGIVMQMEPVAFDAGIELKSEIEGGITVPSDPDSFSRIAHILIDNAVKYSGAGDPVGITLAKRRSGVVFSVSNRGVISPDDLPRLFDRFYRADSARSSGGHGLGLSIAKNLTKALRGEISVSSTEGDGTVFTVSFPDKA